MLPLQTCQGQWLLNTSKTISLYIFYPPLTRMAIRQILAPVAACKWPLVSCVPEYLPWSPLESCCKDGMNEDLLGQIQKMLAALRIPHALQSTMNTENRPIHTSSLICMWEAAAWPLNACQMPSAQLLLGCHCQKLIVCSEHCSEFLF